MSYPSKADKLPPEIKAEIGRLRLGGWTIDAILNKLRNLGVEQDALSRSGLARHVKRLEARSEKLRRSRDISEALVSQFGERADNKAAQVNIELMHDLTASLIDQAENAEGQVELKPIQAMQLAKALDHLASAQKGQAEYYEKVERQAREQAAKDFEKVAKSKGMSAETVAAIKAGILGVKHDG